MAQLQRTKWFADRLGVQEHCIRRAVKALGITPAKRLGSNVRLYEQALLRDIRAVLQAGRPRGTLCGRIAKPLERAEILYHVRVRAHVSSSLRRIAVDAERYEPETTR